MRKPFFQRFKIPHVFVLLTSIILFCSILTYVIPSGTYQREKKYFEKTQRTVVIPGTYERHSKHISLKAFFLGEEVEGKVTPVNFPQFLSAIPRGMEEAADIIFLVFIIGGVFGILQRTGTISAFIQKLLRIFGNSGPVLTIILMTTIAIGGSTFGMGEEFIPLIPVFLLVSKKMGYDRIYGLALVVLGAEVGFAAATTNPFTVNVAQGIAELPLNSGIAFRILFFACCMIVTLIHILRYGTKVKKNPSTSIMVNDDFSLFEYQFEEQTFSTSHFLVILSSASIFGFILYAVQELGWWINQMAGGYLLIGFVAIVISRLPLSEAAKSFVKGMEEMVVAALVIGFARGIQVVMVDGQILDTMIYSAATVLENFPAFVAAEGMFGFQTVLNLFIPSGSGQAAVTMPLMVPLADILGLTRQTAVFAFTCGDGFSNTIIPTSGFLMAMLSLAKVPYEKWLRFVLPLFLQLTLLAGIFLAIAVVINYQ